VAEERREPLSKLQARRLMEIAADFEGALRKLPPKKADKYRREQQAVADCRRRAATNRRLLDMRLD
jgi:hypothetical protein